MGSIYRNKFKDKKTGKLVENPIYWLSYYKRGKRVRESSKTKNRAEALRKLREREGDIARGVPVSPKMDKVRFWELADAVVTDYKLNERRSLEDLETRLRLHVLPYFGEALVVSITPGDIEKYKLWRKKKGAANATINRELAVVKRAFKLAIDQGKLTRTPNISMLSEKDNVRKGFARDDKFQEIVGHLGAVGVNRFPRVLRALAIFFYVTGWRKSEVLGDKRRNIIGLQWQQVEFEARRVALLDSKNGQQRTFPINGQLLPILEEMREYRDKVQKEKGIIIPWVFHRNGKPVKGIYKAWKEACKLAGCPGLTIHDLRRTAVRNLSRAGVTNKVARALTGHKTNSVFDRYNIVDEQDIEAAGAALDERKDKILSRSANPSQIARP